MNPYRRSPFVNVATILVYAFLYFPILGLILYSFNASRTNITFEGFIPAFSDQVVMDGSLVTASPCGMFHWYCDLTKNGDVLEAAGNTLTIAFTATIIATVLGTMAALALQRYNFRIKPFSRLALYIPIVIPEIVMGIGILTLFSQFFAWANQALNLSGEARLSLGITTVIVSHIAFMLPFVTLIVQARLQGIDRSVEEAAMDLGAREWNTFRRITLPMIMPGILSGALLAFTLSLDDFVITFFTNGPGSTTLPIYVYGLLRRIVTPQVNALSTIWILVVFLAVLLLQLVQKRDQAKSA